jgi:hypothetical protein
LTTSAASLPAAASVLMRVISCPPGARIISTFTNGKRLLNALMVSGMKRAMKASARIQIVP